MFCPDLEFIAAEFLVSELDEVISEEGSGDLAFLHLIRLLGIVLVAAVQFFKCPFI